MTDNLFPVTDVAGTVELANGVEMPYLGLGTFGLDDAEQTTSIALDTGYRLVDTASSYGNEVEVGAAVRAANRRRQDLFVTTKVQNPDHGYDRTLAAFDGSLERLGLDHVDLYLVHWPVPGSYRETWRALERIYDEGRARAIGVSNFLRHHLDDLLEDAEVTPMVDQFEFHPRLVQQDLIDFCHSAGIACQASSPLIKGEVAGIGALCDLAAEHERSVAQIVLRWSLQKGVATIPKSDRPERITENAALFDFELSATDMSAIDALDMGYRAGRDPDNIDF